MKFKHIVRFAFINPYKQTYPVQHQLEHRVEAHIFLAFWAYCLMVTLRHKLRGCAGEALHHRMFLLSWILLS
ncbi:MAG: hypothetical protein JW787_17320 [Sedimentisphaerales bacterium]|nr:hypothetical protein [Sedimentisphaerales bacterium]